jgi:hypothetical protein
MSISTNRNTPSNQRAPKSEGSGGGGGGGGGSEDNPYINKYRDGVGIFDPHHVSETEPMLYAEPTVQSGTTVYLKLRAMLTNILSLLRRPFIQLEKWTSDDPGGARMVIQPPTKDDKIVSAAQIKLEDKHRNDEGDTGSIALRTKERVANGKYIESSYGNIYMNGRTIDITDLANYCSHIKFTPDKIIIGNDDEYQPQIWLIRRTHKLGNGHEYHGGEVYIRGDLGINIESFGGNININERGGMSEDEGNINIHAKHNINLNTTFGQVLVNGKEIGA